MSELTADVGRGYRLGRDFLKLDLSLIREAGRHLMIGGFTKKVEEHPLYSGLTLLEPKSSYSSSVGSAYSGFSDYLPAVEFECWCHEDGVGGVDGVRKKDSSVEVRVGITGIMLVDMNDPLYKQLPWDKLQLLYKQQPYADEHYKFLAPLDSELIEGAFAVIVNFLEIKF